jgi:hypothetical protein
MSIFIFCTAEYSEGLWHFAFKNVHYNLFSEAYYSEVITQQACYNQAADGVTRSLASLSCVCGGAGLEAHSIRLNRGFECEVFAFVV